jgi:hypothetical protein
MHPRIAPQRCSFITDTYTDTHPQILISKTRASDGLLKSQSFLIAWSEGYVPRIK